MVINTPTRGRKHERDGFKIRRKTVELSIPCLTSLDTAKAIIECIKLKRIGAYVDIVSLDVFNK